MTLEQQRRCQEANVKHAKGEEEQFAFDVMKGLSSEKKFLHFKYLYDKEGSYLFEKICEQPEYYPTRTEAALIEECSPRIADLFAEKDVNEEACCDNCGVSVIELGSGSSTKTRILLREILKKNNRVYYFPIDISSAMLKETESKLSLEFPQLYVEGIPHDYGYGLKKVNKIIVNANDNKKSRTRTTTTIPRRKLVLFLGSSIGNFEPRESISFLRMLRGEMTVATGDLLLVGFDLHKDKDVLDAAYNDKQGITAKFNLNLLRRINAELQGQFNLNKFTHTAFYDEQLRRVEMHLTSTIDQEVYIGRLNKSFRFKQDERIHTEYSYKYDISKIAEIAKKSGFVIREWFMDDKRWFCLALFQPN